MTRALRIGLLAGLAVLAALYLFVILTPAVGIFHDDGIYVVTAKALAEGEGYGIISLPTPIAQTKYPFFFPALLSVVWWIFPHFPDNAVALKLVPLVASAAWMFLIFHVLVREAEDRRLALAVTVITALSPWVLFVSTSLLAETTFAAAAWGALLCWRRHESGGTERWLLAVALLAGVAFTTRTIGSSLMLAGAAVLFWRRDFARASRFLLYCALAAAPWLLWSFLQGEPSVPAELSYYTSANYSAWNLVTGITGADALRVMAWNALIFLVGIPSLLGITSGELLFFLIPLGILPVIGIAGRLIERVRLLDVFVVGYLGFVFVWAWPPTRFLIPIYPALLFYAWEGLRRIFAPIRDRHTWRRYAVLTLLVALLGCSAWTTSRVVRMAGRSGVLCPVPLCTASWREHRWVFDWLRDNTPPEAVFMSNLDPTVYLYTGRRSVRTFSVDPVLLFYSGGASRAPLGDATDLARRILRVEADYVTYMPSEFFGEFRYLPALVSALERRYPDAFERVAEAPRSAFRIYRIDRSVLASRLREARGMAP